jgi:hypothetical protein
MIGTAGTAVSVTGTNFDSTPSKNTIRFNPTQASVTGSTPTTIDTSVPVAGRSGKISVTTQYGTASSAQDFFVPPSGYTAQDVGFTGRMSIGGPSLIVTISANKVALVIFDGTAGQQMGLGMTTNIGFALWSILKPDGTTLNSNSVGSPGGDVDFQLPVNGTYTVVFNPGTATGNVTFTLSD